MAALGVVLLFTVLRLVSCRDMLEIISSEEDLTEFYNLIQYSEPVKYNLRYSEVTVFAPSNAAWRKRVRSSRPTLDLLNYHFVKASITSERFPASLSSEILGGLPIWVSQQTNPLGFSTKSGTFYANNGEIVRVDIKGNSMEGADQVLHVIDEVLEPTVPQNDDLNFRNPSAFRLLSNPQVYGVVEGLSSFEQRVNQFRKSMLFQSGEGHTFFLPVDGNNAPETWNRVDDKVIDAHIIPDKVFYVKSFPEEAQETLSFNDNLKVVLRMRNQTINDGRGYELSVESATLVGNQLYPRGTVVAKVLRANIPVKNGVVHLIENPLVVINKNVAQLLQQNVQLSEFFRVLQLNHPELLERLKQFETTVFAPSNEAFRKVDPSRLQVVYSDEKKVKKMLNLHVSPQRFTTEQIIQGTSVIPTFDQSRQLHFIHYQHNTSVVGGGVNASISTPDIGALNGVLQIIDQVMGIPYRSIYEKLEEDSSLSETFLLGKQSNYNERFRSLDRVFTYFAPNNEAWFKMRTEFPSEYSKLFSGQYSSAAEKVLDRHTIVNKEYSLEDLLRLGEKVKTVSGDYLDVFESNGRNYMRWQGETAEVVDADVDTSNGKVHVIRAVLFKHQDLSTPTNTASSPPHSILVLLFIMLVIGLAANLRFR